MSLPNFSENSLYQEFVVQLEQQALAAQIDLTGWELTFYPNYAIEGVTAQLTRLIADFEAEPTEEITERREVRIRVPYQYPATVWDFIKLRWLKVFRQQFGLTAPAFLPKYETRYAYDIYYFPVRVTRTEIKRIIAAPGTRSYKYAKFTKQF